MADATLKTQSHEKLTRLAALANRLDEMADRAIDNGRWTLAEVIEREQERLVRVRRVAIDAHLRVWGA